MYHSVGKNGHKKVPVLNNQDIFYSLIIVWFCLKNKKYNYGIRDIYYLIIAHYCLIFTL